MAIPFTDATLPHLPLVPAMAIVPSRPTCERGPEGPVWLISGTQRRDVSPALRQDVAKNLRDWKVYNAAVRLAGATQNPYESALRLFFPEETEEGLFLTRLLEGEITSPPHHKRFPITADEFVDCLNIILRNTANPLVLEDVVRHLEFRIRSIGQKYVTPGHPLPIVVRDHFELITRLITQLEKSGVKIVTDEDIRKRMEEYGQTLGAIATQLFLGSGARDMLCKNLEEVIVEATGGQFKVFARTYRSHKFQHMAAKYFLSDREFERDFLVKHFTVAESDFLNRLGLFPWTRLENFYSRMAGMWATKLSVLHLLKLPAEDHSLEVQVLEDGVTLSGKALEVLGGGSLLVATADKGDVGIGLVLLETAHGASGLSQIKMDISSAIDWDPENTRLASPSENTRAFRVGEAVVTLELIRKGV